MTEDKKYSVKELAETHGCTKAAIYGAIHRLRLLPAGFRPKLMLTEVEALMIAGAIRPKKSVDNG